MHPPIAKPSLHPASEADLTAKLEEVHALFKRGEQERAMSLLAILLEHLRESDPRAAVAAILAFLQSGRDSETGWGIELGNGGVLTEWPTMRVALLDLLGQLDVTAAENYCRSYLDNPRSADEWTVGMRNLAWAAPGNAARHSELLDRFERALGRADWLANPSDGYLEAFDLGPYLGNAQAFDMLSSVQTSRHSDSVVWASFLALDRMVLRDRARFLAHLANLPPGTGPLPDTRASLMARADPRNQNEVTALETYLARQDFTGEEASLFASLFPNHNLVAGHRLLSLADNDGRPLEEAARVDIAALAVLSRWQSSTTLSPTLRPHLPILRQRLEEHVASARRAAGSGELNLHP